MLRTFKNLLEAITAPFDEPSPVESDRALQLACAVLLVEVMRADAHIDAAERDTVVNALRQRFSLADSELAPLVKLAEQTARTANDYYQFTSSLNDHFTQPQKVRLIETMWQVAYADAHLDAHENQVISKIAGLLYVTHGEYIGAKMRAKEAAGLLVATKGA